MLLDIDADSERDPPRARLGEDSGDLPSREQNVIWVLDGRFAAERGDRLDDRRGGDRCERSKPSRLDRRAQTEREEQALSCRSLPVAPSSPSPVGLLLGQCERTLGRIEGEQILRRGATLCV